MRPLHEEALTRLEVPHFLLLSLHAAPVLWPPFLWHMLQVLGQNFLAICLMDLCVHMFIILAVVHEAPFTYLVSAASLSLHALWCLWWCFPPLPAGAAGLGAAVRSERQASGSHGRGRLAEV